ncbi:hypothetical protein MLD38_033264 [Melastoma candidum]|uniref:Uncharacterized protein n=1 Tax=Melastoma candidum TaxID=119954 RepID=A0ACB9M5Z7_9MYRT|nr:hypothetical protein MLD38_033264 [Melastoma candidum]
MEAGYGGDDIDGVIDLPPGFRFHPTDEEIISHYLAKKVIDPCFSCCAIGEADLNKCEPWDLPERAKMGEKEWYFFCRKDRKYPTGMRTNRATGSGYWKATGKDKEIFRGKKNCLVGMKKTLVFYMGRAPKGEKSNWVMHEYRLEGKLAYYHLSKPSKDEWVVCRVFHKSTGNRTNPIPARDLPEPAGINISGPSSSIAYVKEDHDGDKGVGNQYLIPSSAATDATYGGDNVLSVPNAVFVPLQFPKCEYPPSGYPFSSHMPCPPDSGYFVGYQGTDDRHLPIMQGPAGEQFSSMFSPSQETGASADANGEITSSAVSGYQNHTSGGYYAYEDPERLSVDPISDILEYSWD